MSTPDFSNEKEELLAFLLQDEDDSQEWSSTADFIPRVDRQNDLPLSYSQQRLWFLYELTPDKSAYNILAAIRLQGRLNFDAFNLAFQEIVKRHEVLRTSFVTHNGETIQKILPHSSFSVSLHDLRGMRDAEKEIQRWAASDVKKPFDLASGQPLRATLLQLKDDEYVLLYTIHHIVSDGWSMGVLVRELTEHYTAFLNHQSSPLPSLSVQYVDFAQWHRQKMQHNAYASQIDYWKQQLKDISVLQIPTDFPRPKIQTFHGSARYFRLSSSLKTKLHEICRKHNVTLFMLMLVAYKVLLSRFTGQVDIAVGIPIANRTRSELEDLIGFFVNSLVIRSDISKNPTIVDYLRQVSETTLEAFSNQEIPFEKLAEELKPNRDMSHPPLFQTMFAMQNTPMPTMELPELQISPIEIETCSAKFDITLSIMEENGGLTGIFEYNTDLFREDTIDRWIEQYERVLQSIVVNTHCHIGDIPLLSAHEFNVFIHDWKGNQSSYPSHISIPTLFEQQVQNNPDACAVIENGLEVTYAELSNRSNRIASGLLQHGIQPGSLVAVRMERGIDLIAVYLAILKVGAAYVPLDLAYPPQRVSFMLDDSDARILVTQKSLQEDFNTTSCILLVEDLLHEEPNTLPTIELGGEQAAYVMYTSGSTGVPKGIVIPHRAITRLVINTNYVSLDENDRIAQISNASFDAATFEIWGALLNGGCTVIIPRDVSLHPAHLASELRNQQITTMFLTTALFNQLARVQADAFQSLRYVMFGGEKIDPEPVHMVLQAGPPKHLLHVYGPTESTTFATYFPICELEENAWTVPIGHALNNTAIYVLDAYMNPSPVGVPGELHIGGDGLAWGYYNRGGLTAEKFVPNPFGSEGSRLYRTGDVVRWTPEGELEFVGRVDHQVKVRGFRIELGEIESSLRELESVNDALALVNDENGNKQLVAYFTRKPNANDQDVRKALQQRLPEYMIPSAVIELESFPLTPNGKIDRNALPKPGFSELSRNVYVAPRTSLEQDIAVIWAELFNLEHVGIQDNFFSLGGHSLLAIQLMLRIKTKLQTEIPLRLLFEHPTVEGLAQQIGDMQSPSHDSPIPVISKEELIPLSYAQTRMWFLNRFTANSSAYNIPGAIRLKGKLDIKVMEQSIQQIINRHESLRTQIYTVDGTPYQKIQSCNRFHLNRIDLTQKDTHSQSLSLHRIINQEVNNEFNLENDFLFHIQLIALDEQDHILLLNMHHIISDGRSIEIFISELTELYSSFITNQNPNLSYLPIQYCDYAVWQKEWMLTQEAQTQINYWKQTLTECPILSLPTDYSRPSVQTANGASIQFTLNADLTIKIESLAKQYNLTLFMLLLGAFQTWLYRITGENDIAVGTPISGRNRSELENVIGLFVNTVVIRTRVSKHQSISEFLQQVRESMIEAHSHSDVPFEKIVDVVQPERDSSHTPLFQVMFTLQDFQINQFHLPEITIEPYPLQHNTAKFDLTMFLSRENDIIYGAIEYNTDLFKEETIQRWIQQYQRLLQSIVENPQCPIRDISLLTEQERKTIVQDWNDTQRSFPRNESISSLFEKQVQNTPNATAVVENGIEISYSELNHRANRIAAGLAQRGVRTGALVAVRMERGCDLIAVYLGILKTGAAYVPLDLSYPEQRVAFMLKDSRADVLITQKNLLADIELTQILLSVEDLLNRKEASLPTIELNGEQAAYVMYTSGSTGVPKGIVIPHRAITRLVWNTNYVSLTAKDRIAQISNASFDAATFEIWGALLHGCCTVIVPRDVSLHPTRLAQELREQKITAMFLTTALFNQVARVQSDAFNTLRYVLFGGEQVDPEPVRDVLQAGGPQHLLHVYGPTESTTFATYFEIQKVDENALTIPIGHALSNTSIYVLDESMTPCPIGVPGELYIGGEGLARGYQGRGGMTAERFVPNPYGEAGSRLYRTGDVVRWTPEGELEFVGRMDHQVKVRGYRIELGEIESALREVAGVRDALAQVREEGGRKQLLAYITGDSLPPAAQVREALRQRLPDYMVPSMVVELDEFPLTPNGKIDRSALPSPETVQEAPPESSAPRSDAERILARIWGEVLGREQIGVHENFFDLGGDSIISIQILSRAAQAGLQLTPQAIFQHQTVAELAAAVQSAQPNQAEQGPVSGPVPLTPIQYWFFAQDYPDPHHWNQGVLLPLRHELDPSHLRRVFQHLQEHHDMLRLRVERDGNGWRQRIVPESDGRVFSVVDLSNYSTHERETERHRLAETLQAGLNLQEGPVMRAMYLKQGEEPDALLWVIHHLLVDGVSWRILLEDLQMLYRQIEQGLPLACPPKTTSFPAWAEALQNYADSEAVQCESAYWLETASKQTSVPCDWPQGSNLAKSAGTVTIGLDTNETSLLLNTVLQNSRAQIQEILLTALAQTLCEWTESQEGLRLDLESHGREPIKEGLDLSRTVGWFTALYPAWLPRPPKDPLQALAQVKERLRAIPRRGLHYGLLRWLSGDEETRAQLQQAPAAEVCFNYLGQFGQSMGGEESLFTGDLQACGPPQSPRQKRAYALEINGGISGNRLQVHWTYSRERHREESLRRVAQRFVENLRQLIHTAQERPVPLSPVDFPDVELRHEELQAWQERGPGDIEAVFPLTPLQHGMLYHTLTDRGEGAYVVQIACDLQGGLNPQAFRYAWQLVLQRHPSLRCGFEWEGRDTPVQIARRGIAMPWSEEDWRGLPPHEQEDRFQERLQEDRQQGFILQHPPLLRARLIRLGEQEWRLLWSVHHLLLDGWSMARVLQEVGEAYAAQGEEKAWTPSEAPSFERYVRWLGRRDAQAGRAYWRQALAAWSEPTRLGIERLPAPGDPPAYADREIRLSREESEGLQSLARERQVTMNALAQGAWYILAARYSGHSAVTVGVTVSGRPEALPGVEEMVGTFINTVPLCMEMNASIPLGEWLQKFQERQLEARAHQYDSLTDIHEWVEAPAEIPLFEQILVFENYPLSQQSLENLRIHNVQAYERTGYPLTVVAAPGEELLLKITYDTRRYSEEGVEQLLGHWRRVLNALAAHWQRPLREVPLLSEAEHSRIVREWNATDHPYSSEACIHQLFEAQVARTPKAVALRYKETELSYRNLNSRANRLAHWLREKGVGPDVCVGLCLERSLEMVVGLYAILKAGGAYVPLDPAAPPERLRRMIADVHPRLILTQTALQEPLQEVLTSASTNGSSNQSKMHAIEVAALDTPNPAWNTKPADNLPCPTTPDNLAYLIFTSGSTGHPKATMIPHRSLVNYIEWANSYYFQKNHSGNFGLYTSFTFDLTVTSIFSPLLRGKSLTIYPSTMDVDEILQHTFHPDTIIDIIKITPSHITMLNDLNMTYSNVEVAIVGGEQLTKEQIQTLENLNSKMAIYNEYGPTEATVGCIVTQVSSQDKKILIGKPINNAKAYVLDKQQNALPVGVPGELYLSGDILARGYANRPDLTNNSFIDNPFGTSLLAKSLVLHRAPRSACLC